MYPREAIAAIQNREPLSPVYLVCPGKAPRARLTTFEPLLAGRVVDALVKAAVDPDNRDFCYSAFYADEAPANEVVLEAQTLPFLAERRVVLVRNAERYTNEASVKPLLNYIANPNHATVLILVADKIDRRSKLFKTCDKDGVVVECPALNEREAAQWASKEFNERGKSADAEAVRELVARAGAHLSDIENAISLTVDFVGPERDRITAEDVRMAGADIAEEEIWALTDAIASSRPDTALTSLQKLLAAGKHPDEIIGTINWLLKSAYQVEVASGGGGVSRFVEQKVRPLADKLGVDKLRAAFMLCTDTQFMLRNTGVDGPLALELLVVKLAAPKSRRKSA